MNPFIQGLVDKAKANPKTIVLPESFDPRIKEAAEIITKENIAKIILIDDPQKDPLFEELANDLYQLRQSKGLTLEDAQKLLQSPIYFGTMLVHKGLADGLVAGASTSTADTFRPALQIIKTAPSEKIVSSFFIMSSSQSEYGFQGNLFFADCALNIDPDANTLAQIAIQTGDSFKRLCSVEPKIAFLSYSTHNSGHGIYVDKVKEATKIAQSLRPDLLFEGEVQADTAIIPPVCSSKCPECKITGDANVLIFPNLDAANISYKLVQRLGKFEAYGPVGQGLNKPISDLSRGCSVDDIVTTVAITSVQALAPISR